MTTLIVSFTVGLVSLCIEYYLGKRHHMYYLYAARELIRDSERTLCELSQLAEELSEQNQEEL